MSMKYSFFAKLQIFLDSRKIFKNWYVYPKVYYKLINDQFVIFKTKIGLKIRIRVRSTDLMALTNVWIIDEYSIEDFKIKKGKLKFKKGTKPYNSKKKTYRYKKG